MSVYERLWSSCCAAAGAGGSLPFVAHRPVDIDIHNFHNFHNIECVDRPLWQTLGPHVD
jgi:hypothetical protein